jgi:hypothetical protein
MIKSGQCSTKEVLGKIQSQETLWVRIAARLHDDAWGISLLDVVGGVPPPNWMPQRWEYDEVVFISAISRGQDVCQWFQNDEIFLDGLSIRLNFGDNKQQNWQFYDHESKSSYGGYEVLEWPYTRYELSSPCESLKPSPQDLLISENSPSFINFAEAAVSFFGISGRPVSSVDQIKLMLRLQDCSGRIKRIRIDAVEMSIMVEGETLNQMQLELASASQGPVKKLDGDESQIVKFQLPNGLPSGSWVVLKSGSKCVDRKFINYPYTPPDSNVEFVIEPMTKLDELVSRGEGLEIEFKCEVPTTPDARKKLCRTIAAFANGEGGTLLFGIDNDGNVKGLSADKVSQDNKDTITNFIKELVEPLPDFDIEVIALENGTTNSVITVNVKSGGSPPYGVKYSDTNTQYYVRRGATTFEASQEQVRSLARSRPPSEVAQARNYLGFR